MPKHSWAQILRTAAVLGAAMGIAIANYVGYLLGALAWTFSPRLAGSTSAYRGSLVVSLAAIALAINVIAWAVLRTLAGCTSTLAASAVLVFALPESMV